MDGAHTCGHGGAARAFGRPPSRGLCGLTNDQVAAISAAAGKRSARLGRQVKH
jgi:hypothetical protein